MFASLLTKTCLSCVFLVVSLKPCRADEEDNYYVAAVFEHAPFGDWMSSSDFIRHTNLMYYQQAVEIASSKNANLIVFPEYGIVPSWVSGRDELKRHAQVVPYPEYTLPCDENDRYAPGAILHRLSCMARNNSITIVANMIEIEYYHDETKCPPDNFYLFNTNIVFDEIGVLVKKYRKSHLLYEDDLDLPFNDFKDPIFQTKYGTFSIAIGNELNFQDIGKISQDNRVDGVAYSAHWIEAPPQETSLQSFESWAIGQNLTLLAANLNIPGSSVVGSGIFNGRSGELAYTYNPDSVSKLTVATIPKFGFSLESPDVSIIGITEDDAWEWKNDGKDVAEECSELLLGESEKDYRCQQEVVDGYNFVQLTKNNDTVEACHNDTCCSVSYVANSLQENFFLGFYNGLVNFQNDTLCEEICILTACESFNDKPCYVFPRKTTTLFMKIEMKTNFSSEVTYPSLLGSGMRLIPRTEWNDGACKSDSSEQCLNFQSQSGRNIIAAGMRSRCYENDGLPIDYIVASGNHLQAGSASFVMAFISTLLAFILKKYF